MTSLQDLLETPEGRRFVWFQMYSCLASNQMPNITVRRRFLSLMDLIEKDASIREEMSAEYGQREEMRTDRALATLRELSGKDLENDSTDRTRWRRALEIVGVPKRKRGRPPKK
jgi:hypothetical protein